MKKLYYILTTLVLSLIFAGCSDNDYTETDKGSDVLSISVSQNAEILSEINHNNDALTLNWTSGNNQKSGNRITYTLEIGRSGDNFNNTYVAVEDKPQTYSWSVNQGSLNEILLNKFGATVGGNITLEARVTATVAGISETQTAVTSFSVSPYSPVTSTLFIVGDAAPSGWNYDNAEEMERTDVGVFSWEGNLNAGEYRFITMQGQSSPAYVSDGPGHLKLSTNGEGTNFVIEEDHYYQIIVNLLKGELICKQSEYEVPAYEQLFFVGDATGWSFVEMEKDPIDPFLFRYSHYFTASEKGEFKFGTSAGNWQNMYKATSANAPYSQTSMVFIKDYDPDNKWYLQEDETEKAYKICVDIRFGRERMLMREFLPYEMIYLVGDATPNGWDIGNATPMEATDNPYIFTWTGNLGTGEIKFTCDKQSDWAGGWFMNASGNNIPPTGETEKALFIHKSDSYFKSQYLDANINDFDQKWMIETAGIYTITLDQLNETIAITKP